MSRSRSSHESPADALAPSIRSGDRHAPRIARADHARRAAPLLRHRCQCGAGTREIQDRGAGGHRAPGLRAGLSGAGQYAGTADRVPAGALAVRALREPVVGVGARHRLDCRARALRGRLLPGGGKARRRLRHRHACVRRPVAGRRLGRGAGAARRVDGALRDPGRHRGTITLFFPDSRSHTDERAHRSLASRHGRTRSARPDSRCHRGVQRRPEPAQGQPRRRRLLRRHGQGAAARMRAARRARNDRQSVAALLSADRRDSRLRPRSPGAAVRCRRRRDPQPAAR